MLSSIYCHNDDASVDASDVPVRVLLDVVMNKEIAPRDKAQYSVDAEGNVQTTVLLEHAEADEDEVEAFAKAVQGGDGEKDLGRGKRKKSAPKRFFDSSWEYY